MKWDVFICYASEDKQYVVKLAKALKNKGLKVWYDKFVLKIGDRLLPSTDEGLANSRYGIVILSHYFFKKDWAQIELDGLVQKEIGGKKVILPVWHEITSRDVRKYSPILAGRLAGTTDKGIDPLVEELISAMSDENTVANSHLLSKDNIETRVEYKRISINPDVHEYSLVFSISLNSPPSKNSFRLKIFWPEFIKISKCENLNKGKTLRRNNFTYIEYIFDYENKIYPGDTIEVISPDGRGKLKYEFDDNVWEKVESNTVELFWEIFFEDQMLVKGGINFRKLNIF